MVIGLSASLPAQTQTTASDTTLVESAETIQALALLRTMTLEQKVAQMFMVSFYGDPMPDNARQLLAQWQPGAVALFPSNLNTPERITSLTNTIQQTIIDNGGLPAFIAVDQEGGIIAHLETGFTRWPVPMLLTATQDTDLAYRFGAALAREMLAVGINMNLAPVADLHTNRANPVIGRRSFGSYPEQVAPIVAATISGMQANGVMATAKHFPGHGDTSTDSHLTVPVVAHDALRLNRVELVPFQAASEAGVGAVMVGHLWMSALEPEMNLPATLSQNVITGLLRNHMAYDGIIMTDAMDMDAIDARYDIGEAMVAAIHAGNDLIAFGPHLGIETQANAMQRVIQAVRDGELSQSRIDASVLRILQAKAQYDVLNWQPLDSRTASARIGYAAHQTLVDEMFENGITIVYDRGDVLPIVGDVGIVYPASRPSVWRSCRPYFEAVQGAGVSDYPTGEEIAWAQSLARRVDMVIVFTQNADTNAQQQALVQALPPEKTVIIALWSPYDMLALPRMAAYMVTYSPLAQAIDPACAIASGQAQARGTLSVIMGD